MPDVVPHKTVLRRQGRLRDLVAVPTAIKFKPNKGATVVFTNGKLGQGTCLGCHDTPCMHMQEARLNIGGGLGHFPGDPSRDVCPCNAIDWDDAGEAPVIDKKNCIGCGLCVAQCPYGAISLTEEGFAVVEAGDPDGITVSGKTNEASHVIAKREGVLSGLETPFVRLMPENVGNLNDIQKTRLVRNMLVACVVAANMRRKGDTNIRMDGLIRFKSGHIGVVELETGPNMLESTRALLEDIAVLHNRYKVPMANIVPVSVITHFPSVRSEYYQVIDDIEKVLDIKCRTLTLGALCMLMWHFGTLDSLGDYLFGTKTDATDLYPSLSKLIPALPKKEPYSGAYRPVK